MAATVYMDPATDHIQPPAAYCLYIVKKQSKYVDDS